MVTEFWRRCKETTPAELIALAFTLASLGLALVAYLTATNASSDQARFQQEQSAPVLTLGTPEAERGKIVTVTTDFASVVKRADRLLLDRKAKRFVVPIRNAGAGIALTVGLPIWVDDCDRAPAALPPAAIGHLGTYLIVSGGSDQLGYLQPKKGRLGGSVRTHGRVYRYSWHYEGFGASLRPPNLLIWYTDGARSRLRWSCVTYVQAGQRDGNVEWAPVRQVYGSRDWPPQLHL